MNIKIQVHQMPSRTSIAKLLLLYMVLCWGTLHCWPDTGWSVLYNNNCYWGAQCCQVIQLLSVAMESWGCYWSEKNLSSCGCGEGYWGYICWWRLEWVTMQSDLPNLLYFVLSFIVNINYYSQATLYQGNHILMTLIFHTWHI